MFKYVFWFLLFFNGFLTGGGGGGGGGGQLPPASYGHENTIKQHHTKHNVTWHSECDVLNSSGTVKAGCCIVHHSSKDHWAKGKRMPNNGMNWWITCAYMRHAHVHVFISPLPQFQSFQSNSPIPPIPVLFLEDWNKNYIALHLQGEGRARYSLGQSRTHSQLLLPCPPLPEVGSLHAGFAPKCQTTGGCLKQKGKALVEITVTVL